MQQFDFGMADGGMAFFHPVPGGRQHPAVPDGHRSDRNLSGCGGIARFVLPMCRKKIIYDRELLLKGLVILYENNRRDAK